MEKLTEASRSFFEDLLKYSQRVHNGYYVVQPRTLRFGNAKYKIHRLIFQLYFNVLINHHEVIHHIDGNKLNNDIKNLQLLSLSEHSSYHHAGSMKVGKWMPYNKLNKDKIIEIFKLSKIMLKKNGQPNYSAIGKKLNIADNTVANYLKKQERGCDGV